MGTLFQIIVIDIVIVLLLKLDNLIAYEMHDRLLYQWFKMNLRHSRYL